MRFSSSLGRSVARALHWVSDAHANPGQAASQLPAWVARIPAPLLRLPPLAIKQLEELASWPAFFRALSPEFAESLVESSEIQPPAWWIGLDRELQLRAGLVREQWEIRGPGLIAAMAAPLAPSEPLHPLSIELVLPLAGGDAGYLGRDRAWLEALLHDVSPLFPESLRVAWLVALRHARGEAPAARQLLLRAAAEVEWLTNDPLTETALAAWLEPAPPTALSPASRHPDTEAGV